MIGCDLLSTSVAECGRGKMAAPVVLVHGWSASSASMVVLRDFLHAQGFSVSDIWMADYLSLHDDVRVPDVVKRMERVLQNEADRLAAPFDMIVHSTGGLVARDWLARLDERGQPLPVRRLLMLAPANFGSSLASKGKSLVGRVVKGWNNWFHTGTEMLNGLELASAYQWALARRDVVGPAPGRGPFRRDGVWPFVICGTRGYTSGFAQVVSEPGSDGTVRPCAANLNAVGMTVDFSGRPGAPATTPWPSQPLRIPFAVLPDRDHGSILDPAADVGTTDGAQLSRLILRALACDSPADYDAIATEWDQVSERTAAIGQNPAQLDTYFKGKPPAPESLHQYMQIITRVSDDQGAPVTDYFLEFFCPDLPGEDDAAFFHQYVIDDVHANGADPSRRCIFIDRTDLYNRFYNDVRRRLAISISASPPGANVRYFDSASEGARGYLVVHAADETANTSLPARLRRNCTHFLDIVIPRQPIDRVFGFSP
jgi:pimeloyl-ACP methyl ester carboxylesterase